VYIDEVSTDISANTSTINWQLTVSRYTYYHTFNKQGDSTLSLTLDGQNVHSSNPVWEVWDGEVTLASGSSTISHNSDGRKTLPFSCTFNPNNGLHGTITVSGNLGLTAIPRSSSVSVSAGIIGSSVTININRQSSSFRHTVRYAWAGKSGTIATNVDTSTTWTIPLDFANDIPTSASGTGTIYVDTYSGSTKTGTQSTTLTASVPANVKPTFSGISLSDLNGAAQNLIPKADTFIQVISNIKVAFNGAVGSYGSSITGYYAEIIGKNQSTSSNGGSLGIMNYHGTIKIRASVSDSRGRWSDAREVSVIVLEYFAPALSFSIARTGSTSSTLTATRNARIAPLTVSGSQKNSMTLTFKVARLGTTNFQVDTGPATGSWTSISNLVNSQANLAGNYLANQSWVVIGILEDKFTRTEFMVNVATESVVLSYDRSGVGVNKIREQGALDVKGDIFANNQPIQQYQLTQNNGKVLNAERDWNDYINTGLYMGSNLLNSPQGGNGWKHVQVFKHNDNWVVQVAYDFHGQIAAVRSKTNGTWNPWKYLATVQATISRKIELGWYVNGTATRNGNVVTISTERKITNINTVSDYREVKETIPAGFRPTQEVNFILQGLSDSTVTGTAILHLATDGKIRLTSKSQGNKYWTGTITYITNDPYP
jgi:orf22